MKASLIGLGLMAILLVLFPVRLQADNSLRGITVWEGLSDQQIEKISSWGVNLVYYFLNPNAETTPLTEAGYLANLRTKLNLLDNRMAVFSRHDIKVVVALWGPPGAFSKDTMPACHRVFAEEWAQTTLIDTWKIIAQRYRGNSAIWGYNLMSEPAQLTVAAGLKNWNTLSAEIAAAVRQIDPDVPIIIQPPYGDQGRFGALVPLKGLGNIIYSFNIYAPWKFTHQGIYGNPLGVAYPAKGWNRKTKLLYVKRALAFQRRAHAPLFVAEFSVARWAPAPSGYRYLRDFIRIFEAKKIHWTYNGESGQDPAPAFAYPWALDRGSDPYNPSAMDTDRLTLLKSFWAKNSH